MKESTRQFYLASMGISMWYSRERLPGAAESPLMDFSVSAPVPQRAVGPGPKEPAAPRTQVSGKKGLQEVRQALGQDGGDGGAEGSAAEAKELAPAAGTVPAEVPEQAVQPEQSGTMQAAVLAGSAVNLVAAYGQDMTLELQLGLARNLLRALGESQPEPQVLQWPVFRNPRVPGNDREGLEKVLSGFLDEAGQHPWVLLGSDGIAPMAARLEASAHRVRLQYPVSLQGLAADPQAKRDLWQKLQAGWRE